MTSATSIRSSTIRFILAMLAFLAFLSAAAAGAPHEVANPAAPAGATPSKPVRPIDINQASRAQLASLPALSAADAQRIVAGRPYLTKAHLLTHRVISASKYQAIKELVFAGQGVRPARARAAGS